jgi:hypothetical protein
LQAGKKGAGDKIWKHQSLNRTIGGQFRQNVEYKYFQKAFEKSIEKSIENLQR